ncbi:unnamed protein product [Linum tenue]|uniref:Ubiquitin-like protease family profile domain-containing protein n=1 Tax=Linum tenue TaxID=586396 RepID=A0AAV0NTX6_9ROSI|nr:unnamed protein product [Linum tenue]
MYAWYLNLSVMYDKQRRIESKSCFLPTDIQAGLENYVYTADSVFNDYRFSYLRNAYGCNKDGKHWYLAVVMMELEEVHLVDSAPRANNNEFRAKTVRHMMNFLYDLFRRLYFELGTTKDLPNIRGFQVISPDGVPTQENKFDVGMWVCLWMRFSDNLARYDVGPCGDVDRMRLTLDLVGGPKNAKLEKVNRHAHEHSTTWKNTQGHGSHAWRCIFLSFFGF